MKNKLLHLLVLSCAAALLTACSKEDAPAPVRITVSADRIALPGAAGSVRTFTVTANRAWEMTVTGEGFSAEPLAGGRGETVVTLTAVDENSGRSRRTLGRVTLRVPDGTASEEPEHIVEILQSPATVPQTMLLYMPGRSLLSYYRHNIESIRKAVSAEIPGDSRILVCYQPESYASATLLEVRYDFQTGASTLDELSTFDFSPASGQNVADMLAGIAEYAPAESYGLIVGCHGKAWVPARAGVISDIEYLRRRQSGEAEPAVSDDLWHPLSGGKRTRSFGDSRGEIDITTFAAAVESLPFRFDYLIFDACFMASVETLYDLRHAFDYVVAAPCEIMAAGFPYDRAVPYLFDDDGSTHDLVQVCREFYDFYQNDWDSVPNNEPSGCISLCATEQLDALADVVRRLYATAPRNYDRNTLQHYEGLLTHVFYDLGHFVTTAYADAALLDEFRERMQAAFPEECRLHTERFFSEYNQKMNDILPGAYWGVSTSEPSTRYREYLPGTAWYKATH